MREAERTETELETLPKEWPSPDPSSMWSLEMLSRLLSSGNAITWPRKVRDGEWTSNAEDSARGAERSERLAW